MSGDACTSFAGVPLSVVNMETVFEDQRTHFSVFLLYNSELGLITRTALLCVTLLRTRSQSCSICTWLIAVGLMVFVGKAVTYGGPAVHRLPFLPSCRVPKCYSVPARLSTLLPPSLPSMATPELPDRLLRSKPRSNSVSMSCCVLRFGPREDTNQVEFSSLANKSMSDIVKMFGEIELEGRSLKLRWVSETQRPSQDEALDDLRAALYACLRSDGTWKQMDEPELVSTLVALTSGVDLPPASLSSSDRGDEGEEKCVQMPRPKQARRQMFIPYF